MGSPNIRDLLTSFSPSLDFFAITSGDGRIKIWDTLKGQLQTEFTDIASSADNALSVLSEPKSGHLSLDYTCIKWVQLESKKKRKARSSLLVLGTGGGDVLALDVSAGQLKWKVSDCHPGGVSAVSFSVHHSCVYTAGVDGMVCQIDPLNGSLLGRFKSSTKAISSVCISADGKILATAAAQLKIFNCADNKKIQKFSGHPVAVRCMIFSEDGQYILSSGVGERFVAIWLIGGGKKKSASCVLSMEHPAIFLDSKGSASEGADNVGLHVLAISEIGLCYCWHGTSIEDLRNSKPTKISLSGGPSFPKVNQGLAIFAAKLQVIAELASAQVFVAYGSMVKPSFEKLLLQYGIDINLVASQDGVLLPINHSSISQKGQSKQVKGDTKILSIDGTVTALDHANAEDAVLPMPKLYAQDKKRKLRMSHSTVDIENAMPHPARDKNKFWPLDSRVNLQQMEEDNEICLEDRLIAVGILENKVELSTQSCLDTLDTYSGGDFATFAKMPTKKIRAHVSSMSSHDAYKFLEVLTSAWRTRLAGSNHILPWIYCILVNHSHFIVSQESSAQMLDSLQKITNLKSAALVPLLKLAGRFRLIMTQIDKAGKDMVRASVDEHHIKNYEDEDEDEDENEDIDELIYGEEEDGSRSGGDDENES